MPTYVYEPIAPTQDSADRFEIRQAFNEPALTVHPTTGAPVRRVISGGLAVIPTSTSSDAPEPGCGPANCQCGRFD
jgi:hypothetical protein